jgi:uncharacterized repeat protein (TIGR04076 family)
MWEVLQKKLGYSDQEMEKFRADPRNADVVAKTPELMNQTIVLTFTHSQGCASGHRAGDKLYFDSAGNLLTKRSPSRVCIHALSAASPLIYAANELMLAGTDPNAMRFKHAGCSDVGLECGGWGKVVMELSVVDRRQEGS